MDILLLEGLEHRFGEDDTKCVDEGQGADLPAESATASVPVTESDTE